MEKRINDISCRFLFQSLEASFHRKWTLKKKSGKKKQNRQQGRFCFKNLSIHDREIFLFDDSDYLKLGPPVGLMFFLCLGIGNDQLPLAVTFCHQPTYINSLGNKVGYC